MNDNSIMRAAQRNKKDDFFTQQEDIQKELSLYKKQFKDKIVFMPCDSNESEFVRFIDCVFESWNIAMFYSLAYNPGGLADVIVESQDEIIRKYIEDDNGDFRTSDAFKSLLKQCDIVVTNPPFSLFREFMTAIINSGKKFIILGNMNQILTKDLFQYVADGILWWGPSIYSGDRVFGVPDDYPLETKGAFIENGKKFIKVKGVRWFTNMHPDEMTFSRAIVPKVSIKDKEFERFDYLPDVICIDRTEDIPYDYDGLMGVPLTYFDRHNPDLFEIVDGVNRYLVLDRLKISDEAKKNHWHLLTVNGKVKYFRILIRRKK